MACAPKGGAWPKGSAPRSPVKFAGVQFPCIHGFPACVIDGWAIPSAGSALVPPDLSIFCAPLGRLVRHSPKKRPTERGAALGMVC